MHKLMEEPALIFDILWAMDGNDSLKQIICQGPADDGDPNKPGPSHEGTNTRKVQGDMYITWKDVNKGA